MANFICCLVLITLVASEAPTEQERKALLDFHNSKRATVRPPAANMLEMVYSPSLENLAVDWVARCKFEHPNVNQHPEYRDTGQNLALSGVTFSCTIQMVWATSGELGCAVKQCDSLKPDWPPPVLLMACQYKPPGNYMGAKPYISGTSCSQCPSETKCVNNLCSKGRSRASTAASTYTWVGEIALFAVLQVYPFV
ncbi:unnamed protein product [Taenia asiatica]|uniref:SCP domain-containing protein n=1 Tax=Taenia asiatica TaxID=60517 RepID=A0A0R3VTD1_TAEAS|nr:unnamed protein product [Taenia asiatica]